MASKIETGLASIREVSTKTSSREQMRNVAARAQESHAPLNAQMLGQRLQARPLGAVADNQKDRFGNALPNRLGRSQQKLVILLRPQRRHDADRWRCGRQSRAPARGQAIATLVKTLDVDAVGNHVYFGGRKVQLVDEKPAMRGGNRDECIGDRRQQPI